MIMDFNPIKLQSTFMSNCLCQHLRAKVLQNR